MGVNADRQRAEGATARQGGGKRRQKEGGGRKAADKRRRTEDGGQTAAASLVEKTCTMHALAERLAPTLQAHGYPTCRNYYHLGKNPSETSNPAS